MSNDTNSICHIGISPMFRIASNCPATIKGMAVVGSKHREIGYLWCPEYGRIRFTLHVCENSAFHFIEPLDYVEFLAHFDAETNMFLADFVNPTDRQPPFLRFAADIVKREMQVEVRAVSEDHAIMIDKTQSENPPRYYRNLSKATKK